MNPYDFQRLVADLLQAMGYYVSWVSPPGKDGGVDIIAYTDALGTKLPRIKVQVKRVGQKVDDGLKSFLAIIGEHDVGLYVAVQTVKKSLDLRERLLLGTCTHCGAKGQHTFKSEWALARSVLRVATDDVQRRDFATSRWLVPVR